MRTLLTGISGQIGSALQDILASIGEVLAADRSVLDLSQPGTIVDVLDRLRPTLIVNPAAYTAVDLAEDQRDLAFRINGEAPAAMARWAAKHGVPLVHFSTDYIFDGSGSKPWREDTTPAPLSVYGASKLAGERAIKDAGGRHLIVRTSWVYAAEGNNFLRTIARLAQEQPELKVVSDQFGAPTSARIIAECVTAILRRELAGDIFRDSGGPVNVTASGVTSWHGFATAIVTGLKQRGAQVAARSIIPIATAEYPTKATRPLNSRLDHHRLQDIFDIEIPSWQTALEAELNTLCTTTRNDAF